MTETRRLKNVVIFFRTILSFVLSRKIMNYYGTKTKVEFNGSCLKQDKATYNHGTIVNIYIVYEINKNYNISSNPTLENCVFGAVSLTKNADIDQYKYNV